MWWRVSWRSPWSGPTRLECVPRITNKAMRRKIAVFSCWGRRFWLQKPTKNCLSYTTTKLRRRHIMKIIQLFFNTRKIERLLLCSFATCLQCVQRKKREIYEYKEKESWVVPLICDLHNHLSHSVDPFCYSNRWALTLVVMHRSAKCLITFLQSGLLPLWRFVEWDPSHNL